MKKYLLVLLTTVFLFSCANMSSGVIVTDIEQTAETGKIEPIIDKRKFANPFPPDPPNEETPFNSMFRNDDTIRRPEQFLPTGSVDLEQALPQDNDKLYVTWLGHSSLLVQIDGVSILLDPVFSNNASPVFFFSVKRFQENPPIRAEDLPQIDAVFISHNHYDHLDKKSIRALSNKVNNFFVPIGVGRYLKRWGVDKEKIHELNWWEESILTGQNNEQIQIVFTPARHSSGRSPFNMRDTLWGSWVFIGKENRVFFSGDTSYSFHFRQIGYHYGPFTLTIMENGQYNTAWSQSHLFPDQVITAHQELRGEYLLPVHWGTFTLAPHDWWEPAERITEYANEHGALLLMPRIGQTLKIGDAAENTFWWREFMPTD